MSGPFGRQEPTATVRQHCPQMTQGRCRVCVVVMVVKLCLILHALDKLRAMFDSWPLLSTTVVIRGRPVWLGSAQLQLHSRPADVVVRSSLLQSNELLRRWPSGIWSWWRAEGTPHV